MFDVTIGTIVTSNLIDETLIANHSNHLYNWVLGVLSLGKYDPPYCVISKLMLACAILHIYCINSMSKS